jgi:addiction module HigA family antidote
MARLRKPHPGEILKEEFLNTIGMNQNQLAHTIGVPGNRIHAVVNGTRDITGDTNLRLCKFFGLSRLFSAASRTPMSAGSQPPHCRQLVKIKPYKPSKAA